MIELSKPLQEDIRKNQLNLKVAIKNHQALVVKLRSTFDDPAEIIKHQLADIQKHIISLGEAQKLLVARVKKEIAAKSWNNNNNNNNNNNSVENDTVLNSDQVHSTNSLQPSSTSGIKSENSLLENEQRGSKRKKEEDDDDEEDDNDVDDDDDDEDDDEEVSLLSAKRHKPMLSDRRPSTPASTQDYQNNEVVGSSSDDSQESAVDQESPVDEVSKEHFMGILNLITKEIFNQLQSKHRERRRRRLAGRHSLYTSNWDLTVQRRTRTRLEREADRQQEYDRGASPVGSPPIVMVNKGHDSSSDSPSPPPVSKRGEDSSSFKKVCIICRKQGILSICENCSATYHWSCLDKIKICPQCQAEQIVRDSRNNSRSGSNSPNPGDDSVSKVLGDTSKPPTRVSSMEVIARYFNRNSQANNENTYTERLKMKKMLEARKAALKVDLANLEEKASQLSASLVNQTANLKELSAGEEKIRERIKIVVDFISSMKKSESQPS